MSPHDLELRVAKLLRTGVILSGIIISIGWCWSLLTSGNDLFRFKEYHTVGFFESVHTCWQSGDYGSIVVYLGLAVLVMLPATRVLLAGILFITQKEKILGWLGVLVFIVLVTSFLLGTTL